MNNIKTYTDSLNEAESQDELNKRLFNAARDGKTSTVRLLLDRGAEVDARNWFDCTPLHFAAINGNTDTARLLLDRGAEVDARDRDDWTPLHRAATNGRTDTAKLLLDRGAEIDARNNDDWTALHFAVCSGDTDTVRLLIQHGADPFKAFDGPDKIIDFFKGDIDWWPEGDLKTKLKRMQRGKSAFGM
jgi:ankyrin repeat protein